MIDQLKSVFDDNRGVSPVIGVILMVAITVILAAVIGTFVLNLGGDLQQTPQAQISIDADNTNNGVDISHNGGDAIPVTDMRVEGTYPGDNSFTKEFDTFTGYSGTDFSVGDSVDYDQGAGEYTVRIIHVPSDSILVEKTLTV